MLNIIINCIVIHRHKVRELIDFVQDDDKLREERKKAKKNKDKYIGLSSEAMGYKGAGNVLMYNIIIWQEDHYLFVFL